MIVKPSGSEQEDRLHTAVGSVMEAGGKVRSATKTVGRIGAKTVFYYFIAIMMFGFLFSNNPIWFKALICAGIYLLVRLARRPNFGATGATGKAFSGKS